MNTHQITLPTINGPMTVEMTAQNISDFHQKLTIYYNDHYDDIENQKEDPYGIIEDEVNQDHGNDNNI